MAHYVQCRLCKQRFDTEIIEAVIVGQKSYYHKTCYEDWVKSRNSPNAKGDEEFWKETTIDYLYRDIQMSIDFMKFNSQWASFTKPGKKMTPKGIYFAVRYHFSVQHGNKENALGGIGIVPFIYSEAAQYWYDLEQRKVGTLEAIIKQIQDRQLRKAVYVKPIAPKEKKPKWDINEI